TSRRSWLDFEEKNTRNPSMNASPVPKTTRTVAIASMTTTAYSVKTTSHEGILSVHAGPFGDGRGGHGDRASSLAPFHVRDRHDHPDENGQQYGSRDRCDGAPVRRERAGNRHRNAGMPARGREPEHGAVTGIRPAEQMADRQADQGEDR